MHEFDKYEEELLAAIDNQETFPPVENLEEEIALAKLAAKNHLTKAKNINIRIPESDLLALKRKSLELNIPYQTLLSSVIHQFATGKLKVAM